jgi:hypothetical protein
LVGRGAELPLQAAAGAAPFQARHAKVASCAPPPLALAEQQYVRSMLTAPA